MPVKLHPHEWVRQAREDRGLRQTDVERQSAALGPQLKISQSHLSKIEKGHSPMAGLGALKLDALRQILGVSTEEWVEKTGLAVVTSTRPLTDAERRGWVLPADDEEPEIPLALQVAAEKYGHGDNAPLSERRWLVELADLDFREEPETPEDWLSIYSRLSKLIDPKAN